MNCLQDRRVLWGGAVIIFLVACVVWYGWPVGDRQGAKCRLLSRRPVDSPGFQMQTWRGTWHGMVG